MPDLEAIGDAATGAVVGRAVEPKTGASADGHTHEKNCLNCGTELEGNYCHACGQRAHVHRSLAAFFHDLLHGVFHFEGKIWNTLPMLAWKPGELTRRYIEGERAKFVSPIALFLFSVFLMFAVVGLTGGHIGGVSPNVKADLAAERAATQRRLETLRTQRVEAKKAGQQTGALDEGIGELEEDVRTIDTLSKGDFTRSTIQVNSRDAPGWLDAAWRKAKQNPDLLFYKLKSNAYKFSWALIPLSVPFVWLLFPFSRRFRLYDHTVFVTYSLCFTTLLVVAAMALSAAGLTTLGALFVLIPPVHMYCQLKGAYALTRFGALWRTLLLAVFALLAISCFFLLLVAIGAF